MSIVRVWRRVQSWRKKEAEEKRKSVVYKNIRNETSVQPAQNWVHCTDLAGYAFEVMQERWLCMPCLYIEVEGSGPVIQTRWMVDFMFRSAPSHSTFSHFNLESFTRL